MTSVISDLVLRLSDSVALTIFAKPTVILLFGLVAGALSVRAQASWRHLDFATTFAAVLALPLIAVTVEEYRTPRSMAGRGGHAAIVEYLLSVGARQ